MNEVNLIARKDELLRAANTTDLGQLHGVTLALEEHLQEWCRANYHYKGAEIAEQAVRSLESKGWRDLNLTAATELRSKLKRLAEAYRRAEQLWKSGTDYCFAGQCAPDEWERIAV